MIPKTCLSARGLLKISIFNKFFILLLTNSTIYDIILSAWRRRYEIQGIEKKIKDIFVFHRRKDHDGSYGARTRKQSFFALRITIIPFCKKTLDKPLFL